MSKLIDSLSPLLVASFLNNSRHFPGGMDPFQIHLWEASCRVSDISQSWLICKSLTRLRWDVLKTPPQSHLCDLSGFLRDVFELHLTLYFITFKLKRFLATCWSTWASLNVLLVIEYKMFLRDWFKPNIYPGYSYKRKTSSNQIVHLRFPYVFLNWLFQLEEFNCLKYIT